MSISTSKAPSEVYAEQLFGLNFGYPLWNPEPPQSGSEVLIGDVGFVRDGTFFRMFNATKAHDDPINAEDGVPEDYQPFPFRSKKAHIKKTGAIDQGALCSKTIERLVVDLNAAESSHHIGAGLKFQCKAKQGAVLYMKYSADYEGIHGSRRLAKYLYQHWESWVEFISTGLEIEIPKPPGLMFISGFHKTADWAVASYVAAGKYASFHLSADVGVASGEMSLIASSETDTAPIQNWGPRRSIGSSPTSSATSLPQTPQNDQCVFINYYRMKRRLKLWPTIIRAAAGYDELPRRHDRGADEDRALIDATDDPAAEEVDELETDRSASQGWDPVEFVLDYILNNDAKVDVAIACDRDISMLCEQHQCKMPDNIPLFLKTVRPEIEVTQDGLGMLFHEDTLPEPSTSPEETVLSTIAREPSGSSAPRADDITMESTEMPCPDARRDVPTGIRRDENTSGDDQVDHDRATQSDTDADVIKLEHRRDSDSDAASVTTIAYSPNGQYIATGADDTLVIIWDAMTGTLLQTCSEHSDTVHSLAFSPDSRQLVSGAADRLAIVYDVQTGHRLETLAGHADTVYSVAYSPNGHYIATGSVDTTVKLWDAHSGQERFLASADSAIVLTVAFSPDSRRLVSASGDCCARIWSVQDGTLLNVLKGDQGINALAYAPDNRRLVTGSDDGSARIWDADTGLELVDVREHSGPIWAVAFSPDGTRLLSAASDGSVRIGDSYSGDKLHDIDADDQLVTAVAISPSSSRICVSSSESIRVWDAMTANQLAELTSHSEQITHLRFSPDATRIVSSSDDGLVHIWNIDIPNLH